MNEEDRRSIDRRFEEIWSALRHRGNQIGEVGDLVKTHIATCTKAEETRQEDRKEMKADLKTLLKGQQEMETTKRIVRFIWAGTCTAGVVIAWMWEHIAPFFRGLRS